MNFDFLGLCRVKFEGINTQLSQGSNSIRLICDPLAFSDYSLTLKHNRESEEENVRPHNNLSKKS